MGVQITGLELELGIACGYRHTLLVLRASFRQGALAWYTLVHGRLLVDVRHTLVESLMQHTNAWTIQWGCAAAALACRSRITTPAMRSSNETIRIAWRNPFSSLYWRTGRCLSWSRRSRTMLSPLTMK